MSGSVLSTIVLFVCVLAKTTKRSAEEKLHKMSQTSVRKEMVHIKLEMTEIVEVEKANRIKTKPDKS